MSIFIVKCLWLVDMNSDLHLSLCIVYLRSVIDMRLFTFAE